MDRELLEQNQILAIIGSDEVGRGPLAGPVVACSLLLQFSSQDDLKLFFEDELIRTITDSKKLSSKKRLKIIADLGIDLETLRPEQIFSFKREKCQISFVLSEKSATYIDDNNILQASLKAMSESAAILNGYEDALWVVDGNRAPKAEGNLREAITVIKGDSKLTSIGLASIIAKEYRDFLMIKADKHYPEYGFKAHAGYGTAAHLQAIREFGVTPIHRKSFKGVKEYV